MASKDKKDAEWAEAKKKCQLNEETDASSFSLKRYTK